MGLCGGGFFLVRFFQVVLDDVDWVLVDDVFVLGGFGSRREFLLRAVEVLRESLGGGGVE